MSVVEKFLTEELSGWKSWEIIWLIVATLVIAGVSIANNEPPLGFIAAVSGVMAVVLAGKGKLSTYLLGLVHVVTYAIISFYARYYGIVMLNVIYYLPMEFYGLYVWNKHMNPATNEVFKKRLPLRDTLILLVAVAILTMIYGSVLMFLNGNLPFVDALGTVVAVVAMYVSIKRYAEQWILWIIVNVVTVVMWIWALMHGTGSWAIFVMSVIYLFNSIIMYVKWVKEAEYK